MEMTRREFVASAAAAGAGLVFTQLVGAADGAAAAEVNVGLIGAGAQGRVLLTDCLKIPGVKFRAVCDIWPYHSGYAARLLGKYGHKAVEYEDYRELLEKEKALDAVIVATPDWLHAEHTLAALAAGKHVYCEKEMSNTIEDARKMVQAAKASGKLLQIGHQRRSNPRYLAALDFIEKKKALGRMTNVTGQWNRAKLLNVGWPKTMELPAGKLKQYGYDTMDRFRNWRWYKKFSGGPIADLGGHQIDVFNWFLHTGPRAVIASGGLDYHEGVEWYDTVQAMYEWEYDWESQKRIVRGFYQTLTTTSHGGYVETIMGGDGSMIISEDAGVGGMRRETAAEMAKWEEELQKLMDKAAEVKETTTAPGEEKDEPKIGHSIPSPGRYYPPIVAPGQAKPVHLPHLENFFDAIRKGTPLNCPPECAFATAVGVLKVNEAVETGKRIELKAEDYKA